LLRLLRAAGPGHASENAALFGDDVEYFLVTFEPGDEAVAGASWPRSSRSRRLVGSSALRTFLAVAPKGVAGGERVLAGSLPSHRAEPPCRGLRQDRPARTLAAFNGRGMLAADDPAVGRGLAAWAL
jgi:hypothetical protein